MRPYRKERVGSLIRDLMGEALAMQISDPRVAPFTTVTRVDVSGDLMVAKVYLSVRGGDAVERRTLAGILHARGFLQGIVARNLSMRQCPELRFQIDEQAKTVRRTLELIEENRRKDTRASAVASTPEEGADELPADDLLEPPADAASDSDPEDHGP